MLIGFGLIGVIVVVIVALVRRPRYITTTEAMKMTGYSRTQIIRFIGRGNLRAKKTPQGWWLIHSGDVRRLAAQRRKGAAKKGIINTFVLMLIVVVALALYILHATNWITLTVLIVVGVIAGLIAIKIFGE